MSILAIRSEVKDLSKRFKKFKRQNNSLIRSAINSTGFQAMHDERRAMPRYIKKPIRRTISGVRFQKAKSTKPFAVIYVDDEINKYLKYSIDGGVRRGGSWGTSKLIIPAFGQRLNKFGNLRKAFVNKTLARTRSGLAINSLMPTSYVNETRTDIFYGTPYFARGDKSYLGYWKKKKQGELELLMGVRSRIVYKKRYPFGKHALLSVDRHFETRYAVEVDRYMAKGWLK